MKREILTVLENTRLNQTVYKMVLGGSRAETAPGQFLELKLENRFLRRPFSVADFEGGKITVLYKVVGGGTEDMTKISVCEKVDVLTELGNLFLTSMTKAPVLVGGGIGAAPMYYLAKTFVKEGITPTIVLGFRNADEAFYIDEFKALGNVVVATDDGSLGIKGNALDAIKTLAEVDYYYACGPLVMLKALKKFSLKGEHSLEARMGCGFGACMGCSIMTAGGAKRVCKEGPVFGVEEVDYEQFG